MNAPTLKPTPEVFVAWLIEMGDKDEEEARELIKTQARNWEGRSRSLEESARVAYWLADEAREFFKESVDPQPAPVARGPKVFPVVFAALKRYAKHSGVSVVRLRQGIEERMAFGLKKYNTTLHRDDGRDPVKDARDEVHDLPGYLFRLLMLGEEGEVRQLLAELSQVVTLVTLHVTNRKWLRAVKEAS